MPLGAVEEPALGSPGHMQAQDYRFSSSWVPQMLLDATEELRMEWVHWLDLAQAEGEKWGVLWLGPLGRESLACSVGGLAWWRPWLGALRGLLLEIRWPAL